MLGLRYTLATAEARMPLIMIIAGPLQGPERDMSEVDENFFAGLCPDDKEIVKYNMEQGDPLLWAAYDQYLHKTRH